MKMENLYVQQKTNLPSDIDDEYSDSDLYHNKKKKEQHSSIISRGIIKENIIHHLLIQTRGK